MQICTSSDIKANNFGSNLHRMDLTFNVNTSKTTRQTYFKNSSGQSVVHRLKRLKTLEALFNCIIS